MGSIDHFSCFFLLETSKKSQQQVAMARAGRRFRPAAGPRGEVAAHGPGGGTKCGRPPGSRLVVGHGIYHCRYIAYSYYIYAHTIV